MAQDIFPLSSQASYIKIGYVAKMLAQKNAESEDSEAIEDILHLTVAEIKQAFLRGYYEHKIRGVQQKVAFRNPFLAYALLIYELKHIAQ